MKRKKRYLILRLPNGSTQLIREELTSAVPSNPNAAPELLLTLSALRLLSKMVAELHLATSMEATDDRATPHGSVDHIQPADTTTSRLPVGRLTPSPSSGTADAEQWRKS
jgi:hypothetical protein